MRASRIKCKWFVLSSFVLLQLGCGTIDPTPKEPEPTVADAPVQQTVVPERDRRSDDDNVLALLDQKTQENQELRRENTSLRKDVDTAKTAAVSAAERESRLVKDVERLESLLKEATEKRRELEDQLLRSRIETVRVERELYRAQIDALATAPVK